MKLLPINIAMCIPTFMFLNYLLLEADIDKYVSIGIAICIYFIDVFHRIEIDYLSDRIKKLEDSQK